MRRVDSGRIAALLLALTCSCAPAPAATRPVAGTVPGLRLAQQDQGEDNPDAAGDASAAVLRLGRLEEQVRALTGQIEQLQFQNRKLEENLRKMQADTDFRFQDLQRGAPAPVRPAVPLGTKRGDAAAPDATPQTQTAAGPATTPVPAPKGGDAFDPDANPDAPGAPKPLGTTPASAPLAQRPARGAAIEDSHAPLDLMRPRAGAEAPAPADIAVLAPTVIPAPSGAPRDTGGVASLVPGGTREEYDADVGLYKQGQYEGAANGFAAFADKYPKDRLVPDAVYLAGESFARLGRHREAAEQFLKISTDYAKSPRAPDALLRLGMSLNALGAREQACATYQEVTKRYPGATVDVRSGVDRELKRARCTGNG